jgi:phosphate starvation-inducible PhoH-like protein
VNIVLFNILNLKFGALTTKTYAFKARSWELRSVESLDILDNLGSNIYLNYKEKTIVRITPKINSLINNNLISDKRRFSFDSIKNNQITIVSGLPGTGKTFIACAEALRIVKARTKYKKILLVKSVTQLPGEELGFLPGDLKEKLEPYMISFIDNFEKIIGETMTRKLRELGIISIQPLAFVRGRSIDNTVIIVDEAQNITVPNMRTLMTRIGNDSKMVILGDVKQRDIKKKSDSSLEIIINKFDNKEDFGTVTLRDEGDIVRNPLIKTIEEIFDDIEETK